MNLYWPKRSMFRSSAAKRKRFEAKLERAEREAKEVLQITHGHCLDGAGAVVMTMRKFGADVVGVAGVMPSDMRRVLQFYTRYEAHGRQMQITDLSLNPDQFDEIVAACHALKANGWHIEWRDHHHKQWEGIELKRLDGAVDVLEVSPNTESGASMQQKALLPKDPFAKRLAKVHRDRDLWLNETPEGETLEFAISEMGDEAFVAHMVQKDKKADVVDPVIQAAADAHRAKVEAAAEKLLGQTRYFTSDAGEKVGVVYGWLPKNVGLHEVLKDDDVQVAVNVRPNGHMSLRSRQGADVCQTVAKQFDGGGHVNASGATLGLKGAGFWTYVLRRGKTRRVDAVAEAAVEALEERA